MSARRTAATVAAETSPARARGTGVTRRSLLATGGLAGAAALVGLGPFSPAPAQAVTDQGVPDYLVRSSYLDLADTGFRTTDGVDLKLETIRDLPAAEQDPKFQGIEDGFVLGFSTAEPLPEGVYTLTHSTLGAFDFFLQPGGDGTSTAMVNRTVTAPKHYPKPRHTAEDPTKPPPSDEPSHDPFGTDSRPENDHQRRLRRRKHLRRVSARRVARGVVAELSLTQDAHVKSAVVWLTRGTSLVGACEVKRVHGARATAKIDTGHRPRGGRYELVVVTTNRAGFSQARRIKLALQ